MNNFPSFEEEILFSDDRDVASLRLKEVFEEYGVRKVSYRQKVIGKSEYRFEVKAHDVILSDEQQKKLDTACSWWATENYFNIHQGVEGVIFLLDGKVRWVGDRLTREPFIIGE